MAKWMEHQQQQLGTWQVHAISAEAAQHDWEAHLAKANEDRRAAEAQRDALRRHKERLTTKVKTLERDAAQRAKAPGGRVTRPTAEGEVEGSTTKRGGGGSAAGTRFLLAGAQAWHSQAEAAAG